MVSKQQILLDSSNSSTFIDDQSNENWSDDSSSIQEVPSVRTEREAVSRKEKVTQKKHAREKKRKVTKSKKDATNGSPTGEYASKPASENEVNENKSIYEEVLQALKQLKKKKKPIGTSTKCLHNGVKDKKLVLASILSLPKQSMSRKDYKTNLRSKSLTRESTPKPRKLDPPAYTTYIAERS
eukprot:scaffold15555_cov180-Amphora_coffeaeformis.AAC.5